MTLYVSTTWQGPGRTDVVRAIEEIAGLEPDGIELGSTHLYRGDLEDVVRAAWRGALIVHNYFPPSERDLVLNIASADRDVREASVTHAESCLRFARNIGAAVYTVHPGFLAEPAIGRGQSYDFAFDVAQASHETAFAAMTESLARLVDTAARLDVALAVETEGSMTNPGVALLERPDEYERLFAAFPRGLCLTLNLAHSRFAAQMYGFSLDSFIARHRHRIVAVEASDNDGSADQHRPFVPSSFALDWIGRLPAVPIVLEFRDCTAADIRQSLALARRALNESSRAVTFAP